MKKFLLGLSFVILQQFTSSAQSNYSVSSIAYNPDPFTAGDTVGPLLDDIFSGAIPIGFTFDFFGRPYDSLTVGSNGVISFNLSTAGTYNTWTFVGNAPNCFIGTEVNNCILAPWQDLNPSQGGQIKSTLNGTAPFRRFVISYYEVPMFTCNTLTFSQQIILYETTNIIETHILNKPLCLSWANSKAIHGLVDTAVTNFVIIPGRNGYSPPWAVQYDSWRFDPSNSQFVNNVVSGKVYQDLNGNCVPDTNELGIPNRPILANGGDFYTYTDSLGNYSMHVDTGTYIITETPPLYYNVSCPTDGSYTLNFPGQFNTIGNNNFSDSILVYCSDLMVDIGTTNLSSCMTEWVGVTYCNQGTVSDSNVVINLLLHDSLQVIVPDTSMILVGPQQYQVNAGLLGPGQCGNFSFQVSVGCDTVGTIYCMSASISGGIANDCDTLNNAAQDCHALIGSFDPNDMHVLHQNGQGFGFVMEDFIDDNDELTYRIRFQNTGNDTAYTVRIKSPVPAELNANSIIPGASSHSYNWQVLNGELIFDFLQIHLPDSTTNPAGSEGFVKFRIQQNPGNLPGTDIVNQARIYFDFNPPIYTNQTHNIIPIPTGIIAKGKQGSTLYPNPTDGMLTIDLGDGQASRKVEIIDFSGRVLESKWMNGGKQNLECRHLAAGSYFIKITHPEKGIETIRFQKK
jgi:uncharacterized repeat protein (TIGR01451 family)